MTDHLDDGEVQKRIRSGKYDFIVVQQGPSSRMNGRETLLSCGKTLSQLCAQSGGQLVFFMVWPSKSYYHTFDSVIANYKEAADSTNSLLCPVGEVWKKYVEINDDYSLYGTDGFHPSPKGSRLAAEMLVDLMLKNRKDSQGN